MLSISELNWTISSHKASQSGHGGGRWTNLRASSRNQCSGVKTGFCEGSAVVDDKFRKAHAVERVKIFLTKN